MAVLTVTDANFDSEVLNSDKPVLVDFWAAWCGPCRAIAPIVEELGGTYAGRAKVAKLNIDENPGVPGKYNIMSIPTLLIFKDGKVAGQIVGAVPKDRIEKELERVI